MIKFGLANSLFPRYRSVIDCATDESVSSLPDAGWLHGFRVFLQRRLDRWRQTAEMNRAVSHLRQMDDQQLRDLGITHADIENVVRHGRNG